MEGQEVRALASAHVDHLDVLALANLVRQRARAVHPEVEPRLGERLRQIPVDLGSRRVALDLHHESGRGRVAVHDPAAGSGHHDQRIALARERLRAAGRAVRAEQPHRHRVVWPKPALVQQAEEAVVRPALHQLAEHRRRRVRVRPEGAGVVAPVRPEHRQLGRLPAVRVDHRHAVAAVQLDDRGRPRAHPPRLEAPVDRPQTGDERGWSALDRHVLAAGSFASSLSACSMSSLARSRLAAESSFFTSFSTTLRLYVWFQ